MREKSRKRNPTASGRSESSFTLLEALVAIALVAMCGAAVLWGLQSGVQNAQTALEQTIALGLAQQLMDEILGAKYCENLNNPYETLLGPTGWESSGQGRQRYNDIDDYHGWIGKPPVDWWGIRLGEDNGDGTSRHPAFRAPSSLLQNWQQEVEVYYVSPTDLRSRLPVGQVSDFRAVEVRIVEQTPGRGRRELAKLREIVAYVPPVR
ncbi:MAG: type II secretion system GspH family protein [Thermoguttaceae bacterium]|nr:type II secretion system GspH family protein [Thermoguttaceae bacterium]MDW8038330.1 type II secretion system protein [Thermoguttaceae bacterium]